jgi:hypothetical protein
MQYPVELNIEYPQKLSRLTTFFRMFMIIPQAIVLYFIMIAYGVTLVISWFAIVITGKFPPSLFNFNLWCMRWSTRVNAYAYLFTDKYPPFSGDASTIAAPPPPTAQAK